MRAGIETALDSRISLVTGHATKELMMPESSRPVGPWGKFVALFLGVPPIAVLAADDDDEADDSVAPRRGSEG